MQIRMALIDPPTTLWTDTQKELRGRATAAALSAGQAPPVISMWSTQAQCRSFLKAGDDPRGHAILIDCHGVPENNHWSFVADGGARFSTKNVSDGEWACRAAIVFACSEDDSPSREHRLAAFQQFARVIGPRSVMMVCAGIALHGDGRPGRAAAALASAPPDADAASILRESIDSCLRDRRQTRARLWLVLDVEDGQLTAESAAMVLSTV